MEDSDDIDNGFSPMCAPYDQKEEAMAETDTYSFHTEMSQLSHEQYRHNMVTRAGNFHQNAHIPYCQSAPNVSTTSYYDEWNQPVSNKCTIPNHDFYQSVPNLENITWDYSWEQSISPNYNPYESVSNLENITWDYSTPQSISPNHNPCQSVPNQSTTLIDNGHQHVKPQEATNIPPIQNDDCNKGKQMVHCTKLSSMESSNSSLPDGLRRRIYTRFTREQTAILEAAFERDNDPGLYTKWKLAIDFQVGIKKISAWFGYRRRKLLKDAEK